MAVADTALVKAANSPNEQELCGQETKLEHPPASAAEVALEAESFNDGGLARFARNLAWQPSRMHPAIFQMIRNHALLPVTLFCGSDMASQEIERRLVHRLSNSASVQLSVRHFGRVDDCRVETLLSQSVVLVVIHSKKDGEADNLWAKGVVKSLNLAAQNWEKLPTTARPSAHAAFGYGDWDPFETLYRNARGPSGIVSESLETLGSQKLQKAVFIDENGKEGIQPHAEQWADMISAQVQQWALGTWEEVVEELQGPDWTFEEVMRVDFVMNRKGMQDG